MPFILETSVAVRFFQRIGFKNIEAGNYGTEMELENEFVTQRCHLLLELSCFLFLGVFPVNSVDVAKYI